MKNRLLSFHQASNKVREMKDHLESGKFKDDVLKRINEEAKISVSSPMERAAYLLNAINGMGEVTAVGERVFLRLTSDRPGKYSRREIGRFLREILRARIHGWSCLRIADKFGKSELEIQEIEELAKIELEQELKAKGFCDIVKKDDTPC